jgi:hypothetical protein
MNDAPADLGATRSEMKRLQGEPTDVGAISRGHREPSIWRYGEIEYHFGIDDRAFLIYTEDETGEPRVFGQLPSKGTDTDS